MAKKVLIDPGHAPGNVNGGKAGYKEYAEMWKLSNLLKSSLERMGVEAVLSGQKTPIPH